MMSSTGLPNVAGAQSQIDSEFQNIPTRINNSGQSTNPQVIAGMGEQIEALQAQLTSIHQVCSEACSSQGDFEGALVHISCCVAIEQDNMVFRNQRGFLRYINGDDGAIEDFQEVIARQPENSDAYFNLAMIYFGQERVADAERNFAMAVRFNAGDAENWNNLGVARFQLGQAKEAQECFAKAMELDPSYQEARDNLQSL
jgi:tetratricopeptide (TPR) repeat protein